MALLQILCGTSGWSQRHQNHRSFFLSEGAVTRKKLSYQEKEKQKLRVYETRHLDYTAQSPAGKQKSSLLTPGQVREVAPGSNAQAGGNLPLGRRGKQRPGQRGGGVHMLEFGLYHESNWNRSLPITICITKASVLESFPCFPSYFYLSFSLFLFAVFLQQGTLPISHMSLFSGLLATHTSTWIQQVVSSISSGELAQGNFQIPKLNNGFNKALLSIRELNI